MAAAELIRLDPHFSPSDPGSLLTHGADPTVATRLAQARTGPVSRTRFARHTVEEARGALRAFIHVRRKYKRVAQVCSVDELTLSEGELTVESSSTSRGHGRPRP